MLKKKSNIAYFKSNQIHSIIRLQDGVDKKPIISNDTRRLDGKNRHKRIPGIDFNTSLQVLNLKTWTDNLGIKGIGFNTIFLL